MTAEDRADQITSLKRQLFFHKERRTRAETDPA